MPIDPFVDQFINNLSTQFNNGWAPYLFHYSDILNIVKILEDDTLYSRNHCETNNLLKKDSGGKTVLNHTPDAFKDQVRLYFRPKTPPFYRKEGFCPNDNQDSEFRAHCPLPIYLLFDSKEVLSNPQVRFSNGNLSKSPELFNNKRDLDKLDFAWIYHIGAFSPRQRDLIVNWRCSEVIIPEQLKLNGALKYIVCRSTAERETLLNLLSDELKEKYRNMVGVNSLYFNREKQYVSMVNLQSADILAYFSNSDLSPFKYTYRFKTSSKEWDIEKASLVTNWRWKKPPGDYVFSILIDGHIAYKGKFKS